jgi:hypothetical protein
MRRAGGGRRPDTDARGAQSARESPRFDIGGRLTFDEGEDERPDSALSLRDVWGAGKEFIESYLTLARAPGVNGTRLGPIIPINPIEPS